MSTHAIADVGPCHNVFISPVDAYQVAAYRMSNLIFSIEMNSFLLGRSGGRWLVQRIPGTSLRGGAGDISCEKVETDSS